MVSVRTCNSVFGILIGLSLVLSGCTAYTPLRSTSDQEIYGSLEVGDYLRITRTNGQKDQFRYVGIDGDAMLGKQNGRQVEVPLEEISEVKKRGFSVPLTIALAVAIAAVANWVENLDIGFMPGP